MKPESADAFILENTFFAGNTDLRSPIGVDGQQVRPPSMKWIVVPVFSPAQDAYTEEENAVLARAECLFHAFEALLNPADAGYDPDAERLYWEGNARITSRLKLSATLAEVGHAAYEVFGDNGFLRRLLAQANRSCPEAESIPALLRKWEAYSHDVPGIRGRQSFSGPDEPCAIFRYCATDQGPSLMYDLGTTAKQACFEVHEELLEDDDYRSAYEAFMSPFLKAVPEVDPEEAEAFLATLYRELGSASFYLRLQALYSRSDH